MDQNQAQIPHNEAQKPTRSVSLDSLVSNHFGCRLTRTNIRFLRLYLYLRNFCRSNAEIEKNYLSWAPLSPHNCMHDCMCEG